MSRHRTNGGQGAPIRLYRDPQKGKIRGVCAGIADYFGFDVWAVRLGAIIALLLFPAPTIILYLILGWLLDPKPGDLYRSREEGVFWRGVRTQPSDTVRALRHKFREMERRLGTVEAHVTAPESALSREIRDLED